MIDGLFLRRRSRRKLYNDVLLHRTVTNHLHPRRAVAVLTSYKQQCSNNKVSRWRHQLQSTSAPGPALTLMARCVEGFTGCRLVPLKVSIFPIVIILRRVFLCCFLLKVAHINVFFAKYVQLYQQLSILEDRRSSVLAVGTAPRPAVNFHPQASRRTVQNRKKNYRGIMKRLQIAPLSAAGDGSNWLPRAVFCVRKRKILKFRHCPRPKIWCRHRWYSRRV